MDIVIEKLKEANNILLLIMASEESDSMSDFDYKSIRAATVCLNGVIKSLEDGTEKVEEDS
jgi:hypothetical protein